MRRRDAERRDAERREEERRDEIASRMGRYRASHEYIAAPIVSPSISHHNHTPASRISVSPPRAVSAPPPKPLAAAAAATPDAAIELPLTVQCKGGCGFFGSEKSYGLCSTCHKKLEASASRVPQLDVLEFLILSSGYSSEAEVQKAVAFNELFPGAKLKESAWDVGVKGMVSWTTTMKPVTQYDAIPRRGESACTFIAAVSALRAVWDHDVPIPDQWCAAIRTGVEAFHLCTDLQLKTDEPQHKNISEVLPYVLRAMGSPLWSDKVRCQLCKCSHPCSRPRFNYSHFPPLPHTHPP
jgi:hypothetical protein